MGKSTFCNFLAGYPDEDPDAFGTGAPVNGSSVTKKSTVKKVQWRGNGQYFTLIDTPGLSDPAGSDADRRQFQEVIQVLRRQIKSISAIVRVTKGTENRLLSHVKLNLKLYKFMFGNAMRDSLITEVTFWSHAQKSKRDREEFRSRNDYLMQQLFYNNSTKSKIVFVDPIDALPKHLKERKKVIYAAIPEASKTQEEELKKLKTHIWEQEPFSCKKNCKFAEKIFDSRNSYPTIVSGEEYPSTRYEVSYHYQNAFLLFLLVSLIYLSYSTLPY